MFLTSALAQDLSENSKRSNPKWFLIGESGLAGLSLVGLSSIWYDQPARGFHAFNDASEWLQMDKVGHYTSAYQAVRINSQILNWAGVNETLAVRYSLYQTLAYLTAVEVLDGFSPEYGASFTDLGANAAGALVYYVQFKSNTTDYFTFKYSYRNSGLSQYRPKLLGANSPERWLKDYNAQTYWLSLNIKKISGLEKFPNWLNLAIGYGANGLLGGKTNPGQNEMGEVLPDLSRKREWALSFDINLEKLFPSKKGVNRAFRIVSFIKIPLPGVVISKNEAPQWRFFTY